uniref:Uncharacterized protein n=1 Tax=Nicotiana tabacum TaxID=4097 RepID=A0A1S3ZPQ9_TOBAC|nr:PREDICTED: uncharacterized protein LOC107789256 [Nicotiana tabacum]
MWSTICCFTFQSSSKPFSFPKTPSHYRTNRCSFCSLTPSIPHSHHPIHSLFQTFFDLHFTLSYSRVSFSPPFSSSIFPFFIARFHLFFALGFSVEREEFGAPIREWSPRQRLVSPPHAAFLFLSPPRRLRLLAKSGVLSPSNRFEIPVARKWTVLD